MIFKAYSNLNKHTKVAICVAPILLILGFAASDLWLENKAMEDKYYNMQPVDGLCDIAAKQCVLSTGEFQISLYQENGLTTANSTFPLDTMTLFLVNENGEPTVYPMGMKDSPYYWYQKTPLEDALQSPGASQTVRFVAKVKGGNYIAEVISTTAN